MRTKRIASSQACALPLTAAILICLSATSQAASVLVNDASEGSVPGKCTLVDAVTAVNTAAAKNACFAGNGSSDTIDLTSFGTPTTITFTLPSIVDGNSALVLSKSVSIKSQLDPSGDPLVTLTRSSVSGTPNFRLLATSAALSLTGVRLSNGVSADRGGAIYASGDAELILSDSVLTNNSAASSGGGVAANCGNITLTRSKVSGNHAGKNGGGIYAADHLDATTLCVSSITLQHATVAANSTSTGSGGGVYGFNAYAYVSYTTIDGNASGDFGGGLYAYYAAHLFASTVSNNTASTGGGGIRSSNYIGLVNTTVSGNTASYGAVYADAVGIYSSTISANVGAGIYASGGVDFISAATVVGSIIQGNTGNNFTGEAHATGSNNIIGPDPSGGSGDYPPGSVDCDAKLGPLADNGGPTKTIALLTGSCAIDAGPTVASVPSDQRGAKFARRVGSATDIGAYEAQSNDRIFYDGFGT